MQDKEAVGNEVGLKEGTKAAAKAGYLNEKITEINDIESKFKNKKTKNPRRNGYRSFAMRIAEILFDIEPDGSINGFNKDNYKDATVHHEIPVKDANIHPEAMNDPDNLVLLSKEEHNDLHNKGIKPKQCDSIKKAERKMIKKHRMKICVVTLFDLLFDSFIFGFLSEFIYGFIFQAVFNKEPIDKEFVKRNAKESLKTALIVFLSAIPVCLPALIMSLCNVSDETINIVQFIAGFALFIGGIVITAFLLAKKGYSEGEVAKTVCMNILKGAIIFGLCYLGELIEPCIENKVLDTFVSLIYVVTVFIGVRFIFDYISINCLKKKEMRSI